jgi:hypothetical protein
MSKLQCALASLLLKYHLFAEPLNPPLRLIARFALGVIKSSTLSEQHESEDEHETKNWQSGSTFTKVTE